MDCIFTLDTVIKKIMDEAILSQKKPTGQRNRSVGLFGDGDLIASLKELALDPSNQNSSPNLNQILWNQMLKVRKVMILNNAQYSQRKRKLEQYINDGNSAAAFGLNSENSGNGTGKKLNRGESSILCPPKSIDNIGHSLKGNRVGITLSSPHDTDCIICYQDFSHLGDFDESIKGSYPEKNLLDNHARESEFSVTSTVYDGINTTTSIQEKRNIDSLDGGLKSRTKEEMDDSIGTNNSGSLVNEDKKLKKTINLLLGDNLSRLVIPIGPRFQADVPKWECIIEKRHLEDDDNESKWLGTQIWPLTGRTMETNAKEVGKGRPSFCNCDISGSVNCVKQHINEARLRLKYDIGPAFWSWKFNEMGEDVSKSWTLEEEKKFKSIVKGNPLSSKTNLWKLACENFPSRSLKSMVSYYYNVYIPRRMSLDTRSSLGEVDSDDD